MRITIIAICYCLLLVSLPLVDCLSVCRKFINSIEEDKEKYGTLTDLIDTFLEHLTAAMDIKQQAKNYMLPTEYPVSPTFEGLMPPCECAVFNTITPADAERPIISQDPTKVHCNSEEEQAWCCHKWCSHLASRSKSQAPQLLCFVLGHYTNLTASVHSRALGTTVWVFTGLVFASNVCCYNQQVVDC